MYGCTVRDEQDVVLRVSKARETKERLIMMLLVHSDRLRD